ncbi:MULTISPECIES: YolD-like family protein [unclassified Bacillus (in: firmicutes)]|uniref:YolD-like family protein n=1 Tax=unclassified Bacillus (in: firmicutes) TaxID=185979 RepID=UPI001BE78D69|nr:MULTISPECIES: YolD-like family protein [unclassified Bacillus (in: firmicutes)]MBT2618535.1 YolD-like family protein [Bacillus sp. ISL-78]MBT2632225.1 YolD-like family protein [Bacillus sp. ISL-101]MBT2717238.1 YolD-like family protein [Bacillus sp. ISL-57]
MLRDRGNIKWQGFFVPEHIKTLKDGDRDHLRTARPQLDKSQIEEIERLLSESLQEKTILEITTWKDGFFHSER